MIVQFLAEFIGTIVYVGAHHMSYSNPWLTGLTIAITLYFLNPLIGEVGASLNPIASLIDYGHREISAGMTMVMIVAQLFAGLFILWVIRPVSALKHFPRLLIQ
jgi:glycerol uptake facilitator-like aquaporin